MSRVGAWGGLALAVVAVSSGSIFARLSHAPPLTIALGRCLIAAAFFGVWALFRRKGLPRSAVGWVALAGVALAVHLGAWIASLSMTTVGVSVLLVNTTPAWILLFGFLVKRERPSGTDLVATALCFAGCAVAVSGSLQGQNSLLGAALALVGALAMAVYTSIARKLLVSVDLVTYVAGCYGTAAVCLAGVALVVRPSVTSLPLESLGWIFAMAVCAQIVGHTMVNRSLERIAAHRVTLALMMEPLLASLAAWAIFREGLTWQLGIAFLLVPAGVMLTASRSRN